MAEETPQEEQSEEAPLELLESRTRKQLNFLVGAGISTVLFMAGLAFTYVSLSGRVVTVTQEPLMEMTNLAGMVGGEYENLNLAVEFHNHLMESLNERLDSIDPSIDQQQFSALQEVLVAQEQDFQYFLETAKSAVFGLSEMVSGSRGWREDFNAKLDVAIATSQQREQDLGSPQPVMASDADVGETNPEISAVTE